MRLTRADMPMKGCGCRVEVIMGCSVVNLDEDGLLQLLQAPKREKRRKTRNQFEARSRCNLLVL